MVLPGPEQREWVEQERVEQEWTKEERFRDPEVFPRPWLRDDLNQFPNWEMWESAGQPGRQRREEPARGGAGAMGIASSGGTAIAAGFGSAAGAGVATLGSATGAGVAAFSAGFSSASCLGEPIDNKRAHRPPAFGEFGPLMMFVRDNVVFQACRFAQSDKRVIVLPDFDSSGTVARPEVLRRA